MIVADLAAHDAHQLTAQLRQLQRQFVEAFERYFTHRGGFQRLCRHRVLFGVHARQADQFAGQVEAGELFLTGVAQAEGLEGARTDCVDRIEGIALAEQKFAFFQRPATFDDFVQRIHVFQIQRKWQTQRGQAAILAMGLVMRAQFYWLGHFFNPCGKTHIRRKGNPAEDIEASTRRFCRRPLDHPGKALAAVLFQVRIKHHAHRAHQQTAGRQHDDFVAIQLNQAVLGHAL
ncbi:hypothetical protein D3C81_1244270 [compost metagenome]